MSKHKSSNSVQNPSSNNNNNNTTNHNNNNNSTNNNNNNNNSNASSNKKRAQTKYQQQLSHEPETTKLDKEVANYLRSNLPNKEGVFVGIKRVNYFNGSKAVDLLVESKWSKGDEATFKTRNDIVIFLNDLLLKRFYHRAKKITKMVGNSRKFKLDMHDVQVFEDSNEPYVWLYEPTSLKSWLLCFGVIFAVIAVCLFPLWPPIIRTWVYYICIAGLAFLSSIFALAIIRHIIFFIIWTLTFGKLHLWILPNLTEDVGFFESFWPLYTIETGASIEGGGSGDQTGADSGAGDASVAHNHQD